MATLLLASGGSQVILPENRKKFSLNEVLKHIDCRVIDVISLTDGRIMIIDDEGKFDEDHEVNLAATILFREGRMTYNEVLLYMKKLVEDGVNVIDAREIQGDDYIAGNAIVCQPSEF
jgi:hypothetical protein